MQLSITLSTPIWILPISYSSKASSNICTVHLGSEYWLSIPVWIPIRSAFQVECHQFPNSNTASSNLSAVQLNSKCSPSQYEYLCNYQFQFECHQFPNLNIASFSLQCYPLLTDHWPFGSQATSTGIAVRQPAVCALHDGVGGSPYTWQATRAAGCRILSLPTSCKSCQSAR